ncbi:MAG: peptide deformylase [Proteobacteria bacterium]|nr:peptide deformylase [Pseudomonadota bacterium]
MSLLTVLTEPDPRLHKVSKPVESVTDELRIFLNDMVETMEYEKGIGLAAPQVGVLKRIIVIHCPLYDPFIDKERSDSEWVHYKMVNPVILKKSDDKFNYEEACLSVPGEGIKIERPRFITVQYLDENGVQQTLEANGLLSICIQHEIDHLDGKLITDFLSSFKKQVALKRLIKRKN